MREGVGVAGRPEPVMGGQRSARAANASEEEGRRGGGDRTGKYVYIYIYNFFLMYSHTHIHISTCASRRYLYSPCA